MYVDGAAGPDDDPPIVYAVVLFWRTEEVPLVERCVTSLAAQEGAGHDFALRVLVVDNGCGATPCLPPSTAVQIELIRLPENRGFTGGHNAGMRYALDHGAKYVFLVNSDLVADRPCVAELIREMRARPDVGMAGPLVLRETAPDEVESGGHLFSAWTGRHYEVGRSVSRAAFGVGVRSVDAVSGCALLVRRHVIERVGGLDDALFFYFEDMDWCLRARQKGVQIVVVPRARVWHRGGGSTDGPSPLTTFYSVRNHLVVVSRYAKRPLRRVLQPAIVVYHLAFIARSSERRTPEHVRAALQGGLAGLRGRLGPRQHARRA